MKKIIDLHIHTNISDGSLSPKEVIDEAVKNGVSTIAIADHDTIEAYNNELYEYAKTKKIKLINAVEISTKIDKISIHVLGYNFNINNQKLIQELSKLRNARHKYLYDVAQKLEELGYKLNINKLDEIEAVTKAHIACDIINNYENKVTLLKYFNHIPDKGEFIEKIMNKGCPAYVKKETITPKEAVELIKEAGGKAILAHPVAYTYESKLKDEEIISIAKEMNVDGIEANYIYIDCNYKQLNESIKWNKIAKANNLIVTIGSDFHNKDDIHPEIGLINTDINLNDNIIYNIINNLLN